MKQTKLSKQQKKILNILGKEGKENRGMNSRDLNRAIASAKPYTKLSNTKRASISRSIRRLSDRGLVFRKRSHYSDILKGRIRCNVLFTTDKGQKAYNKMKTVNKKSETQKS